MDTKHGKVLIVDDEEGVRVSYDRYFTGKGFAVRTAGDGRQAIARLQDDPPDVVVADLKMPGMDGIQLLQWIHERSPETRFILLTGYGNEEVERQARALGAYEYLNKPISPETLAAIVTAATHLQERGAASRGAPGAVEATGSRTELREAPGATGAGTEVDEAPESLERRAEATVAVHSEGQKPGDAPAPTSNPAKSRTRRTAEVLAGLVVAPVLGLLFVMFLPVIGFGVLFWTLGQMIRERLRPPAEA